MILMLESLAAQHDLCFADCYARVENGEIEQKFYRRVTSVMGGGGGGGTVETWAHY